ncbi:hypothetical protein [Glycomyces buryatensis]|uniref:Uncharacterized protein n=1 Tax=Glycomyces buryatensis TaxID=2570927 RepID=A0A4S8QI96_9ACTN|nr:hypothetical protein [Glycomyces buryatensis]THV43471.1 hypothetical protein FAB82_01010 [Glycomyces buryatensis]
MNLADRLRRFGTRQILALAATAVLLAAAVATLPYSPQVALALFSLVLLYVLLRISQFQRGLGITARSIRETQREQRRLRRAQQEFNREMFLEDYTSEIQRIEALQQKILAAVETGRLETAERFDELERQVKQG